MSNLEEREITIEVEEATDGDATQGNIYEVQFTRRTYWDVDNDYGSDADGNRGVRQVFIDEDRADDVRVKVGDKWTPLVEVSAEIRKRVEEAVAEWLEDNEAEFDSYAQAEPEREDDDRDR